MDDGGAIGGFCLGEAFVETVVAFPFEFFLLSLTVGVEIMSLVTAVAAGEAFIGTNGTVNNFFNALTEAVSTLEFFVSPFFLGTVSVDDDDEDRGALSNCFNALTDSSFGTVSVDDDEEDRGALSNCFNALTDSSLFVVTTEGSLATMEIFVVEPRILFNAFIETTS